jgi:hypothetical protein
VYAEEWLVLLRREHGIEDDAAEGGLLPPLRQTLTSMTIQTLPPWTRSVGNWVAGTMPRSSHSQDAGWNTAWAVS